MNSTGAIWHAKTENGSSDPSGRGVLNSLTRLRHPLLDPLAAPQTGRLAYWQTGSLADWQTD